MPSLPRFAIAVAAFLAVNGGMSVAVADPFRSLNPRRMGDRTETAFSELFVDGDYREAKQELIAAVARGENDPLTFALRGAIAYTEQDWEELNTYANRTIDAAENLRRADPVRGELYTAVGNFLAGAYILEKQGILQAIPKLQRVLQGFSTASRRAPNDPEVNLLKGYLDLLLAVNLSNHEPEDAIARFQANAAPSHLVDRGLSLAYRDLGNYTRALEYVDRALAATPNNPEIHYLKGQILYQLGKQEDDPARFEAAVNHFDTALSDRAKLPETSIEQIEHEADTARKKLAQFAVKVNWERSPLFLVSCSMR